MDLTTALAELEALGTAQNRKVYPRHGVRGPLFGVSYADLDKLRKKIGRDTALAQELWATGNHDARVLATKVADPGELPEATAEAWVGDLDNYVLTDAVSALVARTPYAAEAMRRWVGSGDEWTSSAGWNLVAHLAGVDGAKAGAVEDGELEGRLEEIRERIHGAPNRTRHAMNGALITIGSYRPALTARARSVAAAIGPVEVDHGETGCKTPPAGPYIEKTRRHLEAKAARREQG